MENKKYQLVAWTRKVEGKDEHELRMIPSLHHDMQEYYFHEIGRCYQEQEARSGFLDRELATRFMKVFEQNARFLFYTGHYGDALRFLRKAAFYCIFSEDEAWTYWDTDLGNYMYFHGSLLEEFLRLTKEFITLAHKYNRTDILTENESKKLIEIYQEQTAEERDLSLHLKKMRAWK